MQENEHFCRWRQEKVAKIVPYGPPFTSIRYQVMMNRTKNAAGDDESPAASNVRVFQLSTLLLHEKHVPGPAAKLRPLGVIHLCSVSELIAELINPFRLFVFTTDRIDTEFR